MKPLVALAAALLLAVPAARGQVLRSSPPPADAEDAGSIRLSPGPAPAQKSSLPTPKPAIGPPTQTVDMGTRGPIPLAPLSTDGQSTVVEELEVIAQAPGPAMWTVSRGDSQVVILGTYSPLPHALEWNHARLDRALHGATALYVPKAGVGVIGGAGLVLTLGSRSLGGGQSLAEVVGAQRFAGLTAISRRSHTKLEDLRGRKPAVAGYQLYADFVRAAGFSQEKPYTTAQRFARARGVPIRVLARIDEAPLIRSIEKLDAAGQLACFDAELAQIEAVSSRGGAAATAWADGRLEAFRSLRAGGFEAVCLFAGAGGRAVLEKGTADAVASIEDALKRPGRSVALVPIEYLTRANGVLDRLRSKGAEIGVPPG